MSAAESYRELLELASKAAGYQISAVGDMIWSDSAAEYIPWNPLTNDGDALRLAVKLRITPHLDGSMTDCEGCTEAHLSDPYAATRLAIVRAAAEIGRAK